VQDKSGVTLELGVPLSDANYTNALDLNPDPSVANAQEIFRWHLVRQYDSHFADISTPLNSAVYRWSQDGNQAYLTDIYDTPAIKGSGVDSALASYAHHVRLIYEQRTDPTQSYRSGWRIDQNLRLSGIDVASKPFSGASAAQRYQVRRYHLTYDASCHASLLSSVQVEGRCAGDESQAPAEVAAGDPSNNQKWASEDGNLPVTTGCDQLPAMTFAYQHVSGTTCSGDLTGYESFAETLQSVTNSPSHSVDEEYTDLFDINSDGLPDVLVTAAGLYGPGHGVFFNGGTGFGAVTQMGVNGVLGADAGTISLNNPNVASLEIVQRFGASHDNPRLR